MKPDDFREQVRLAEAEGRDGRMVINCGHGDFYIENVVCYADDVGFSHTTDENGGPYPRDYVEVITAAPLEG